MIHTLTVDLPPEEVLARAKAFFASHVPLVGAFLDREGPRYVVLRGQGTEELTISVTPEDGRTRVRASTLFYDQALDRFFATLPGVEEVRLA